MPETPQEPRHKFSALTTLAAVLAAFLLAAAAYVCWQAAHILFPQNVYETALPITISDTIEADGVLLFDETCISGSGNLGYLVSDGERVSAGTAVAELYTDANQAVLRQQLTQLTSQIDLLQRSQNTAATQLDGLLKERSGALYDLLDALDTAQYSDVDESTDAYLLAQNKLWITTGDTAGFADQIALLAQQAQTVQAQLGNPTQIAAPTTGYFVRAASSGRLNAGAADILAQSPEQLKAYLDSDPEMPLDGCVGKLVSGFSWQYAGVCSAKQAEKLLGADGKPLRTAVEISFPGQSDAALRATVAEVTIDAERMLPALCCNATPSTAMCCASTTPAHASAPARAPACGFPPQRCTTSRRTAPRPRRRAKTIFPACTSSTATSPVSARLTRWMPTIR